jgi:hypothetical protein
MDFGQDASHAQDGDGAFTGSVPGDYEERRFPDPGLAADNKRGSTLVDPVNQMIAQRNVLLSALQNQGCRWLASVRRLRSGKSVFFVRLAIV